MTRAFVNMMTDPTLGYDPLYGEIDWMAATNPPASREDERDEARAVAKEYYFDLRQHVSDYQWHKHWAGDALEHPWLGEPPLADGK